MTTGPASPSTDPVRQPHAVFELDSRQRKARKIEQLLELEARPGSLRLLEVGTGAGGIAGYFGQHASGRFSVDAVDVVDNRRTTDGFNFRLVEGTRLPFEDECFDVVISNHVIEHVGDRGAQLAHLEELRRVLRCGGIGYLAVPNRWMPMEPHFRLLFLSWLPRRLRSPYLRLSGKGLHYDCEPLELREVESLLRKSGLASRNICIAATKATFRIERPGSLGDRLFGAIPDAFLRPWLALVPTLVYQFWRSPD